MRKILPIVLLVLLAVLVGLGFLLRKAPSLAVTAIERQLGKDVQLQGLRYHFPSGFEIRKLAVVEKGTFNGEQSFYVENVSLQLNLPALLAKKIVITSLDIKNPQIIIRKLRGRVTHALSPSLPPPPGAAQSAPPSAAPSKGQAFSFLIERMKVREGYLRWIDYDIAQQGFVLEVQRIDADMKDISLDGGKISYEIAGEILQGRDHAPAAVNAQGWANPASWDTDTKLNVSELWVPYFEPYYKMVTPSVIDDGIVNVRSGTVVKNKHWSTSAQLDVRQLSFKAFEAGDQIFGIEAPPLLDLLKNRSGAIALNVVIDWNMADPSVPFSQAMRRSLQESIKSTFLNNIGTVVENTLDKISEDPDFLKKDWKNVLNKIKETVD